MIKIGKLIYEDEVSCLFFAGLENPNEIHEVTLKVLAVPTKTKELAKKIIPYEQEAEIHRQFF